MVERLEKSEAKMVERFDSIEAHLVKLTKQTPFFQITFGADNERLNELQAANEKALGELLNELQAAEQKRLNELQAAEQKRVEDKKELSALITNNASETGRLSVIFFTVVLALILATFGPTFGLALELYIKPHLENFLQLKT
jgi:hypothetical protein